MEFRLLGPLEVVDRGRPLVFGRGKHRALLALLLLHANEVVATSRLIDELWGETPPPTAGKIVRNYVSSLRKVLGAEEGLLQTHAAGYCLALGEATLDLEQFEQLVDSGRRSLAEGDAGRAAALLRQALALWHGAPLADFAYEAFAQREIARLEELRLGAVEERIEADLRLGRHAELVPELESLVGEHPLRERLREQLMLALYRSGRQAEALATYQEGRRLFVSELGLEPGRALQELERRILSQDSALEAPARVGRGEAQRRRRRAGVLIAAGAALLLAAVAATVLELTRGGAAGLAGVASNSVGVIDPMTRRIVAQIPVGASPSDVAVGAGSVWVTSVDDQTVTRFDFNGGGIREKIRVGGGPGGIAADRSGVWVANSLEGTVSRIDPKADTVVQSIAAGSTPVAVALGAGAVWVASENGQTLSKLDARSGAVTARFPVGVRPRAVAVGAGSVWVADETRGVVFRIDPIRRTIVDTINVGNGPADVAVGVGSVWVANNLDGTVSRIDPERDTVESTIPVGDGPRGLAIVGDSVWVSNEFGGTLAQIDPRTNTVHHVIRIGEQPEGMTAAGGRLFVAVRSAGGAHRGGTLRLVAAGGPYEPGSVDTLNLSFAPTTILTNDGLVGFRRVGGADGGQLVPDLAVTLPTPTDGGRIYTFHLRGGIRYSNGRTVRPGDFRRAIERSIALNHDYYLAIAGAKACTPRPVRCDLSRGIVTDDRSGTVTFHLSAPDPNFLYELALPGAFAVPASTPLKDVGLHALPATGPYMIASYKPGGGFTLVRNPLFREWSNAAQPAGYPDRIVVATKASPGGAVRAVERGARDLTFGGVPLELVHEVKTQYASRAHVNPIQAVTYLFLNTRVPPFDDARVRRAVNYAADRSAGARISTRGTGAQPTCQILPPNFPGFQRYCPYTLRPARNGSWKGPDLDRARRLVAASGTSGARVTIWEPENHRGEGSFAAALLRSLGYRARVKQATNDVYYNPTTGPLNPRLRVQAGLFSWFADYPAASNYITTFFACNAPSNWSQFCNHRIEAKIRRALALQTTDLYLANQLWARIDRAVVDQAPVVPLYTLEQVDIVSSRVGNYQYQLQWGVLLDELWVR